MTLTAEEAPGSQVPTLVGWRLRIESDLLLQRRAGHVRPRTIRSRPATAASSCSAAAPTARLRLRRLRRHHRRPTTATSATAATAIACARASHGGAAKRRNHPSVGSKARSRHRHQPCGRRTCTRLAQAGEGPRPSVRTPSWCQRDPPRDAQRRQAGTGARDVHDPGRRGRGSVTISRRIKIPPSTVPST